MLSMNSESTSRLDSVADSKQNKKNNINPSELEELTDVINCFLSNAPKSINCSLKSHHIPKSNLRKNSKPEAVLT